MLAAAVRALRGLPRSRIDDRVLGMLHHLATVDPATQAAAATVVLVRRLAVALAAVGLVGALAVGAGQVPRPTLVPVGAVAAAAGAPGFGEIALRVEPGPGLPVTGRAACALLAATTAQHERGLMGRRSTGTYAGMLFTFPAPTTDVFYMAHTLIPLTLAWFDASGRYLSSTDMAPCPSGLHCPYYSAGQPYALALEVPRGALGDLGIGPGSAISGIGPCIGI